MATGLSESYARIAAKRYRSQQHDQRQRTRPPLSPGIGLPITPQSGEAPEHYTAHGYLLNKPFVRRP